MALNCPGCKQGKLIPDYIDELFPCLSCKDCKGHWIKLIDYLYWLDRDPSASDEKGLTVDLQAEDTLNAMVCPVTGKIMLKYRLSIDNTHRVDLSPSIGAIWLDKGEWGLIKKEGLSRQLNKIFTDPWQRKIRAQRASDTLDAVYTKQFGPDAYDKLKEFRIWLDKQENKHLLMAYLHSENPYKV